MIVVKMGGAAGIEREHIVNDVAALAREGRDVILVHGGSDETNRLAEALGHPPEFVTSPSGHVSRRCDRRTLEIFMMATALINRLIKPTPSARNCGC